MLGEWLKAKLESARDCPLVILRDPLGLVSDQEAALKVFRDENEFVMIRASTNLAFRDCLRQVMASSKVPKILLLDQSFPSAPAGGSRPPVLFYPDLLARVSLEAQLYLDLRQFLIHKTGDGQWPPLVNEGFFAGLARQHLEGVLRAHQNLAAQKRRSFSDDDLKTVIAFAALGVPEYAFKKLDTTAYWSIGLLGHDSLENLKRMAPEVAQPILASLRAAPAPFCWLAERDPEEVVRAFYLGVVLSQHRPDWPLLLPHIDPGLQTYTQMDPKVLEEAPQIVDRNPERAMQDLAQMEASLGVDGIHFLVEQLRLTEPEGWAAALERERYSVLLRALALLFALDNLLSNTPHSNCQKRAMKALFESGKGEALVDMRACLAWDNLKEAYRLAQKLLQLRVTQTAIAKTLAVQRTEQLTLAFFRDAWGAKALSQLEFVQSSLERLLVSTELLPLPLTTLPSVARDTLHSIRSRAAQIGVQALAQLDALDQRFQELVALRYPQWAAQDGEAVLTAQFLRRVLKPNWDPQTERAVLLIFDGMRLDIWQELLWPALEDRMDLLADVSGCSLLPSETHFTRKAICAGSFPDAFEQKTAENALLQVGLKRELGLDRIVEVRPPEGSAVGLTVRYQAGPLDVYIFDLCDSELHGIGLKTLSGGLKQPERPLSFIYHQHIQNIIQHEVMAIVRALAPGTKVFVVSDHGFSRIGPQPIWFYPDQVVDCYYRYCLLRESPEKAAVPSPVQGHFISFSQEALRLPKQTFVRESGGGQNVDYAAVAFPRPGYSFKREVGYFEPPAFTHGGISMGELLIPMVALRVKPQEEALIEIEALQGPLEATELDELEFRIPLRQRSRGKLLPQEVRVDITASFSRDAERFPLPARVLYASTSGTETVFRLRIDSDEPTDLERRAEQMERTFTATFAYLDGSRNVRKTLSQKVTICLNSEQVIRRIPPQLGNILGMSPKKGA
jgi:HPt (histidine-containing phosphotransfer) domain-containing protein